MDKLLEKVLLEAELLDLEGRPRQARQRRGHREHARTGLRLRDHPCSWKRARCAKGDVLLVGQFSGRAEHTFNDAVRPSPRPVQHRYRSSV